MALDFFEALEQVVQARRRGESSGVGSMTDMSSTAVTARIRHAAAQSDLRTDLRLLPKLDMTPSGIARRLAKVESLRWFCLELVKLGERSGLRKST